MLSMETKCGYLVVLVEVLSWAETVCYRRGFSLFWRLGAVFLWWEALLGPVSLTSLKPLCCIGGMSPGLHCTEFETEVFITSLDKLCCFLLTEPAPSSSAIVAKLFPSRDHL